MRDYLLALLRSFTLRISLRRPAEGSGHRPVAAHCEVLCFALSLRSHPPVKEDGLRSIAKLYASRFR